jgi:hypothetical protein
MGAIGAIRFDVKYIVDHITTRSYERRRKAGHDEPDAIEHTAARSSDRHGHCGQRSVPRPNYDGQRRETAAERNSCHCGSHEDSYGKKRQRRAA